jgi:hypothetical protein
MFGPSPFPSPSTHLFSNREFITDSIHFNVPTLVPLIKIESTQRAATIFSVPKSVLINQSVEKPARHNCQPNSKKLTQREEQVIVSYILDLDRHGFAPTYAAVRDMTNKLLAARGAGQVGIHWPRNFVKRTHSLTTRFNQAYNRQRALSEDPALISQWFKLVEKTKAKYGIFDKDVYNFDEAGFMMGKITTQLVMTGSERRDWPKAIQPGNCE